jgi:hypothetical protein
MRILLSMAALSAVIGAATAAAPAQAALSLSFSGGIVTSTPGASTVVNFDGLTGGTFAGSAGLNIGTNPGGGGNWGSVLGSGGSYTLLLGGAADYLGFLWGTRDGSNTVSLLNGAAVVGTFAGSSPSTGSGSYANLLAPGSADYFDRVVFTYGGCCFEFDNIATRLVAPVTGVVPVPAPVALLASGLLLLGGLARRRS